MRATTRRPRSSSSITSWPSHPSPSSRSRPTTARNSAQRSAGTFSTRASATSRIKPRTPLLNGKVERSHRIDSEEFYRLLEGQVIDDVSLFNTKLQEWEDYYNYDRPHGALTGQTPHERLRQKAQNPLS
ncbi:integrase core domain-containing protein [Streptomyces sp. NBC_00162]|uniref:integrase core domain-containing protein n=1 Tax=Streptomyces sp. NBC_00162 TaxID=2903629 RepID=UPI003A4C8078